MGLSSSGLHTNGYSLARHIIKNKNLDLSAPISQEQSLQEALLATYQHARQLSAFRCRGEIKGMAHITGGGLLENIPRILPTGLVHLDQKPGRYYLFLISYVAMVLYLFKRLINL